MDYNKHTNAAYMPDEEFNSHRHDYLDGYDGAEGCLRLLFIGSIIALLAVAGGFAVWALC